MGEKPRGFVQKKWGGLKGNVVVLPSQFIAVQILQIWFDCELIVEAKLNSLLFDVVG